MQQKYGPEPAAKPVERTRLVFRRSNCCTEQNRALCEVIVGDAIVRILSIDGNQVRMAVEAPPSVIVRRMELHNKIVSGSPRPSVPESQAATDNAGQCGASAREGDLAGSLSRAERRDRLRKSA